MANITAKDVAALRAKTGIGMMECKKALVEANGDMDEAIKILRERGLAVAAKKADRIAADGIVDILTIGEKTAMIEVNTETDFVAKNATFKEFVKNLLETIINNNVNDVEALMASKYLDTDLTVEAKLQEMIFAIGEKISIRRFVLVNGVVSTYIHGMGSIGCIVKFDVDAETAAKAEFVEFSKNIALQVGAYPVSYLDRNSVPASVLESEKEIIKAQLANDEKMANKPEKVLEGIIMGKIGKFYDNNCLVDMEYVKSDDHEKVGKYVENTAKALGTSIKLVAFCRYEKGEGIQKREEDFAAEIAKLAGQ